MELGKTFQWAKNADVVGSIATIRYYAGWADKIHGQTIETDKDKLAYTVHEPFGVVGQIIPWNFPRTLPCRIIRSIISTGHVARQSSSFDVELEGWPSSGHRKPCRHETFRVYSLDRSHGD